MTFSAVGIFNEANNTDNTWIEHYGYSSYRPDEAWRGPALNRFEIQPIIDVTRLPEHHYLPFSKAKDLVESLADNEFPMWLTVPDFFLPTENLEFIHENQPDSFKDKNHLHLISEMVGISIEKNPILYTPKGGKGNTEKWQERNFTEICFNARTSNKKRTDNCINQT